MSLQSTSPFSLSQFPIDSIDSGQSVLITGTDSEVLATTIARIIAPDSESGEQTLLLGTTDVDTVAREIGQTRRNGKQSTRVITEPDQRVPSVSAETEVNDIGDMTALGMQVSDAMGEMQMDTDQFRLGIFLCSDMCRSVDDIRSVYRFLNTSFLSELRRNDAIGACAVETDVGLQTDMESMISSMSSSFDVHLQLQHASPREATYEVTGPYSHPDSITVSL